MRIEILEPVSPELVLIDPRLAEVERARLRLGGNVALGQTHPRNSGIPTTPTVLPQRPIPPPVERREQAVAKPEEEELPPAESWGRIKQTLLTASLIANGIFVAVVVALLQESQSPPAFSVAVRTNTLPTLSHAAAPHHLKTAAAVERVILATLVRSPGKLPRAYRDKTTGLARTNLQTVCRPEVGESFSCVVRPALHRPGEGLHVRYRVAADGRGALTWSRYRSG